MRGFAALTAVVWLSTVATADAQPRRKYKPGATKGIELAKEIKPAEGFVDDPVRFDGAGGRLLYVNSNSAELCDIIVLDLGQGYTALRTVDISKVTNAPLDVRFAIDGEHYFVTYKVGVGDDAKVGGALVDSTGAAVRTFGPATDVRATRYDGEFAVAVYDAERKRSKKGEVSVDHSVEVLALATGKRIGKKASLTTDETGHSKKLDFHVQYWLDSYTKAVGVKGGVWDRKEDQRSPDVAAVYDLPQKLFARRTPIRDVTEHARRTQLRQEHANERSFLYVENDLSGVKWFDHGKTRDIGLAQPFHHYDPKSMHYQRGAAGEMYFTLTIDPVNPDAVARKKADPKWLDLYRLEPGGTKAKRVGRLLLGKRDVAWVASPGYWAVVPKHIGFSRGGKLLRLYKVK